jgi:hypothetical protein
MNLCDSLHKQADFVGHAKIPDDWNTLLNTLQAIVKT